MTQESQTLDLAKDFFRFVTGFFEVISTSAPHIYHSALLLSPQTSSVQELYGPQTTFMTRVIRGMPTSWDPSIANYRFLSEVKVAAWSSCSKFIAVACFPSEVEILDATTLERLHTLDTRDPSTKWGRLRFSPDGHLLTGCARHVYEDVRRCIASWDLQTGGLISYINPNWLCSSITYSGCGMMLGGYFPDNRSIIIYDIFSGAQILSHSVTESIVGDIWTYGEYVQYAVVDLRSITIWEVSFTSSHPPIQVRTLPTPDNFPAEPKNLVFLPILSLLAFTLSGRILVWDAQHQKILLDSTANDPDPSISFSPDGQLLVYRPCHLYLCLCKKSPDGYLPYQKLLPSVGYSFSIPSPDAGSIISFSGMVLQLWHMNSLPSLQSIPSPVYQTQHVYLEFLPDESSVAIAESSEAVTILDLESGDPQGFIDVGMEIHGMEVIESEIIVVGSGESIIWELPAGDDDFGVEWDVEDSIQTITFEEELEGHQISISPNFDYMVGIGYDGYLVISDVYTGKELCAVYTHGSLPGFCPDGDVVWCATQFGEVEQWKIVEDGISGTIKLEYLNVDAFYAFPCFSSCGYEVTEDGWVVSSGGRHLLWLPHQWQSDKKDKVKWSGNILALLYTGLPNVVILELEV